MNMTTTTRFIEVENLHKSYLLPESGRINVLNGVTFSLEAGSTLAITGHSGSGKSTLLTLLAGLDSADHGRIVINNAVLTDMDARSLHRFRTTHLGIVFQQFHLLPHLTAGENICLPLELQGRSCSPDIRHSLLARVGLTARSEHLPGQLSGGECQRVAIARALAVKPLLLLADEPTGNLDLTTGRDVADLLFTLVQQEQMTLIVVTHNQELAARCSRQLHLTHGVLQ
ncbi:ABC transporter ATP-binding protein [Desulfobulbus oligotrophicus]|nr:ABC transporter ATP-binding protein [Desulfobulbus oligotrophicus]